MKGALSKILQRNEVEELSIDELLNTMNQRKETDVYENADALVMPVELRDAEDVTKILEEAQEGNIVILNIKDVQARNPIRLRTAMASIKASVTEMDGDLARLTEDLVLITPARVKIVKRKQ